MTSKEFIQSKIYLIEEQLKELQENDKPIIKSEKLALETNLDNYRKALEDLDMLELIESCLILMKDSEIIFSSTFGEDDERIIKWLSRDKPNKEKRTFK